MNDATSLKSLIQQLTNTPGLSLEKVNAVLGVQMAANAARSDEYAKVFESSGASGRTNLSIQRAELRLPGPEGRFNGILIIEFAKQGIAFNAVRAQLPALTLIDIPHGHAVNETTVYGYSTAWGSVNLGVLEGAHDDLTTISFEPSQMAR